MSGFCQLGISDDGPSLWCQDLTEILYNHSGLMSSIHIVGVMSKTCFRDLGSDAAPIANCRLYSVFHADPTSRLPDLKTRAMALGFTALAATGVSATQDQANPQEG